MYILVQSQYATTVVRTEEVNRERIEHKVTPFESSKNYRTSFTMGRNKLVVDKEKYVSQILSCGPIFIAPLLTLPIAVCCSPLLKNLPFCCPSLRSCQQQASFTNS